jgi:ABC-2 type transport system ATP-binding protein
MLAALTFTNVFRDGDINLVLNKFSGLDIADILIQEPDLEEIFLHYYEKESSQ